MNYCPTCGTQLHDNAAFCENCGTRLSGASEPIPSAVPTRNTGGRKLHCPECGGTSLAPVVESTNEGGVAVSSPLTRRVGVTSYSNTTTHRNYWMCQDCGHKFRNLQNLREELTRESKRMKALLICGIIFTLLTLPFALMAASNEFLGLFLTFPVVLLAIGDILFWVGWFITRNKVAQMSEEERYLKSRCFGRF